MEKMIPRDDNRTHRYIVTADKWLSEDTIVVDLFSDIDHTFFALGTKKPRRWIECAMTIGRDSKALESALVFEINKTLKKFLRKRKDLDNPITKLYFLDTYERFNS